MRVLLVEDDPLEVLLFQQNLQAAAGVRLDLQVVGTLAEAVAELEAHALDVVLLDLSLPDSQGLATVTGLLAAQPEVPVVVLTGTIDEGLASAAIEAGAQDYLVKGSVTPEVLGRVVRHACERHELRLALQHREDRFRAIAEAAQDGIYRLRYQPEFLFEYLNPALELISGFTREQFHDAPTLWADRLHPDDLARVAAQGLVPTGGDDVPAIRFQRADGEWIVLEHRSTAIVEDGVVVGVQGVVRDVTAQQRTTQALHDALRSEQEAAEGLRATNAMKGQFLQAVSHELRTPLTSIMGFARTMVDARDHLRPEQFTHFNERILDNAQRLESLMTDLLDLGQLTHTELQVQRVETDITALASRTASEFSFGLRRCTVEDDPCVAAVDPTMVTRILGNVLGNAVKHTPPATTVRVRCAREAGTVTITVSDDGPGIDEGVRERAFEPFWQGPAMQQASSPGTGVGLAIVRQFAGLHDGHAWLEQTPGGGLTVQVELATGVESAPVAAEGGRDVDPVHGPWPAEVGWRQLTTDDRRALQATMRDLLHAEDAAAATATLVDYLRRSGAEVIGDGPTVDADVTICLDVDAAAVRVTYPDAMVRRTMDGQLLLLTAYAGYALATSRRRPGLEGAAPVVPPVPAGVDAAAPLDAAVVALWATRELLAAEQVEELVGIVLRAVSAMGGTVVPARLEDERALPLDLALGTGEPLLPVADPQSVARMQLERHLPGLVADARRAADRLRAASVPEIDPISGLASRHEFQRVLSRLRPDDVVVALDLHEFRELSDAHGPAVGEEVVRGFASCLREQVRVGDHPARVGHDEFALLLRGTGHEGARELLERLHWRWEQVRPHPIRFSAGFAVGGEHDWDTMRNVDQALYVARNTGRHAWHFDVVEGSDVRDVSEVRA